MTTFEKPNTQRSFQPRFSSKRNIFTNLHWNDWYENNMRLENVRYNLLIELTSKVHVIIDFTKFECRWRCRYWVVSQLNNSLRVSFDHNSRNYSYFLNQGHYNECLSVTYQLNQWFKFIFGILHLKT